MSIDMSQFYQVFFEEAQEHLDNMEALLLKLDIGAPDPEQLNAIFRAAHSIKGSAGTFGFTDLAEVTHILENLLDRVRKGELALRSEIIDAGLEAGDVLKKLLAAHRDHGEVDATLAVAMRKRLSELTHGAAPAVAATPEPAPEAAAPAAAAGSAGLPAPEPAVASPIELDVSFVIDMDPDIAAAEVDNLIAELGDRWAVRVIDRANEPGRPWHLGVAAEADPEIVRGMVEFIARSDSIRIGQGDSRDLAKGSDDGAYGFFDDLPEPEKPAADESWGLFGDTPAPAPEPVLAPEPAPAPALAPALADAVLPAPTIPDFAAPDALGATRVADRRASPRAATGGETSMPAPTIPDVAAPNALGATRVSDRRAAPRSATGGETSIRVDVDKVDQLINLIGELVITQAMLAQCVSSLDPVAFERLHNGVTQLDRNTRDMQESVLSIRMLPISVVFSRFPRVVRDLAQKLGKQIELETIGEGTELDKGLIERISDPLTHLVRNSIDHGVELPDERIARGKPPIGTITLRAYHQSGNIVIEVGDDGAGLNRQKILAKAREKGLPVNDQMTDADVWHLIFDAGFSTADVVTEVSGRGVGMDVVKRNIKAMGGRVEIESELGRGTRMTVRLPLTLAILDGMAVSAGKETYIIPLGFVIESLQAERGMIKSVSGVERLLQVRGEYLPVVALYEVFGIPGAVTRLDEGIMVVIEADGAKAALFIDALVGQHQVVMKSLESNYRKVPGISGATIMGDGHVALILDVAAMVHMAKSTLPVAA